MQSAETSQSAVLKVFIHLTATATAIPTAACFRYQKDSNFVRCFERGRQFRVGTPVSESTYHVIVDRMRRRGPVSCGFN